MHRRSANPGFLQRRGHHYISRMFPYKQNEPLPVTAMLDTDEDKDKDKDKDKDWITK